MELRDRYLGSMVGVLAGDALGAPYEKKPASFVKDDLQKRGGLVAFAYESPFPSALIYPPGRPTDDSELTAALAESLVHAKGCDTDDQYRRYRAIAVEGKGMLWDGP